MSSSMSGSTNPRRFTPLDPRRQAQHDGIPQRLEGIIFDVDGTLCRKCQNRDLSVSLHRRSYVKRDVVLPFDQKNDGSSHVYNG